MPAGFEGPARIHAPTGPKSGPPKIETSPQPKIIDRNTGPTINGEFLLEIDLQKPAWT
jgi:hypothetical protein